MAAFVAFFLLHAAGAQYPPPNAPPAGAEPGVPLSPQQLDDLVAPIALYPDPVVGVVLAASTYPMEIAEAEQWVRDHPKWKPSKRMDEAKKQNWDPSVQGLVAFPDVLTRSCRCHSSGGRPAPSIRTARGLASFATPYWAGSISML